MTLHITEKDVGREVVHTPSGVTGTILQFEPHYQMPIVIRWHDGIVTSYTMIGTECVRFADAPEAKPPETVTIGFDKTGEAYVNKPADLRPELFGKMFIYGIEGEKL